MKSITWTPRGSGVGQDHVSGSGGLEFKTHPLGATCSSVKKNLIYPVCGRSRESTCPENLIRCSKRPRYHGYKKKERKKHNLVHQPSRMISCFDACPNENFKSKKSGKPLAFFFFFFIFEFNFRKCNYHLAYFFFTLFLFYFLTDTK